MTVETLRDTYRSAWTAAGWLILVAAVLFVSGRPVMAESFRIETKVFVGDEKAAVSETTTLFLDGIVYDFLKKPEQTAVFRKPNGGKPGRFILLSDNYGIQTEVSTKQLEGTMSKLRNWASRQRDPFLQFSANPEFEESFDKDSGKLVLANRLEKYSVTTMEPEHPDALGEYHEFLDWYTQLNTLLSAGGFPPEPRLRLNAALARHKVVPQKVELVRPGQDPCRAEHTFTWRISQDDRKQIDNVRAALSSYKNVKNDEFLRTTTPKEKTR